MDNRQQTTEEAAPDNGQQSTDNRQQRRLRLSTDNDKATLTTDNGLAIRSDDS